MMMRGKKVLSIFMIVAMVLGLFTGAIMLKAKTVKADAFAGETTALEGEKYSDIENAINDGTLQGISSTFQAPSGDDENLTSVFKVIIPEDGYVYLKYWRKSVGEYNNKVSFTLYSDVNLTNEALGNKLCYDYEPVVNQFIQLKKGTYYLEAKTDRLFSDYEINIKYGAYFGYLPKSTQFITLSPSTKSATNQDVTIKVNVNEDCKEMWMMPKEAPDYMLDNEYYWTSDYKLSSNEFKASQNGTYTVRIQDIFGNQLMEYITITNIDKNKPDTPIVTRYYANSKKVSGSAEKGSTVSIVIGSKTYKATAGKSSGKFSVATATLGKGTKIKVYCQDKAGNKSDSKTVSVK